MELVSTFPLHSHTTGRKWLLALVAVPLIGAVAAGGYWGYLKLGKRANAGLAGAKYHAVAVSEMQVKVNKDGELQAVNNIDVICQVESGTTIVQLVKEGAFVKEGDVLVTLDGSALRQKIEDTSLDLQRAEADLVNSKEMLQIQESQNAANLDAAKVDVELAKLGIEQYTHGLFPQDLSNAKTAVEMARITVANKEDDLRQTRELYAKTFVTLADVKSGELALTTAKNDLNKAQTALTVLEKYSHPMDLASKQNLVAQAVQKLARTQKENASNYSKAKADVDAKDAALLILKRRFKRLGEQLEFCTIKAPAEGLVVYANNRDRESSGPIQEGSSVRERQVLLRLPDTTEMKAVIKVNETQVSHLSPGLRAMVRITGVNEAVGATLTRISPVMDSGQRWWNPDLREYPVELTLDTTPPNMKPGIGVQAEIQVDSIPDALSVPLAALYAQGADSFVFIRKGENVEPRKVSIGQSNETHARINTGLTIGEQVLLLLPGQGRELLEKAGIQPSAPDQPKPGKRGPGPGKQPRNGPPKVVKEEPTSRPARLSAAN